VGDDVPTVFFLRLFYVNDGDVGISSKPVGELGISCVFCYSSYNAYYAPAPVGEAGALGGHRRLSSVRLSVRLSDVAYIGSNSKTKRPRKTKLCTGVLQVTCDSHTDFKVKRSKGQKVKSQGGAGA